MRLRQSSRRSRPMRDRMSRSTVGAFSAALILLVAVVGVAVPAAAAERIEAHEFPNESVERAYKRLIADLRCPNCLNTNLAGSDAPIAQDLRRVVHRLLVEEAMSEREVEAYLQARYGDFVLYDPPLQRNTYLLWFALPVLLFAGRITGMARLPAPAVRAHRLTAYAPGRVRF